MRADQLGATDMSVGLGLDVGAYVMTGVDQHTRPEEEQRTIVSTPMARRGELKEFVDGGYTAMEQ